MSVTFPNPMRLVMRPMAAPLACAEISQSTLDRADSTDNASARSDNHGHWIKNRVASKAGRLSLPLAPRCESSPRQWREGFRWLRVSRRIQDTAFPPGFAVSASETPLHLGSNESLNQQPNALALARELALLVLDFESKEIRCSGAKAGAQARKLKL